MSEDFIRDMVGYGRRAPDPRWPNGARLALQFVINYEEGGERTVLNGDDESESYLAEVVGIQSVQGRREPNAESIYEYGSRAGFWRLHRLFLQHEIPVTVYAVALALERNREAAAAMSEASWEIASHGLRWIDYGAFDIEAERTHLREAIRLHRDVTGSRPRGWYTGRVSTNTRKLLIEEGGFLYDSDNYSDDLPYWDCQFGKPHLVIPYALDSNDFRFSMPQGFNAGSQFLEYLKDSFDFLYDEGAEAPKMLSIGLHCRISGRPGRTLALARFLDYVSSKSEVWICRREDIARHWHSNFPPETLTARM